MAAAENPPVYQNRILNGLAPEDLALIEPGLKSVALELRQVLEQPQKPIKHVYFPESGMVSVVAHGARMRQLEVGIIGREGVSGSTIMLGDDRTPHSAFVQIAGRAIRIRTADLKTALAASPRLHTALLRYVHVFMIQTAHTAASNGSAKLEERLARWLLMAHDRVDGDDLPLVHEFLAVMLGVRRPGVTVALHTLEGYGLIRSRRGSILVTDRSGLEKLADVSYGVPESEYRRLIG